MSLVHVPDLADALEESATELQRFMPWNRDAAGLQAFIEHSTTGLASGTAYECAIYERGTANVLGSIGLNRFDPFTPLANVGYWIRTSKVGRGFATDALLALLNVCASEFALERLDAQTASDNIASQRVLRKCGFIHEGDKLHGGLCHGVWHDHRLFGRVLTVPTANVE